MIETIDPSVNALSSTANYKGMVVTDFDGTLRSSQGRISTEDINTLHELEKSGYLRVIATGRSLFSLWKAITPAFPVDYIIFSSGAGIFDCEHKRIIRKAALEPAQVRKIAELLILLNSDFMIHFPIPGNHKFLYFATGRENSDFNKRRGLYKEFSTPFDGCIKSLGPGTQFVAIEPPGPDASSFTRIQKKLPGFSVLRTTSPLDGSSTWIEIFPENISKSHTADWLANIFGLGPEDSVSIGNDYNDFDLLNWAGTAFVVANAPEDMKRCFQKVSSNDESGLTEAVRKWLDKF